MECTHQNCDGMKTMKSLLEKLKYKVFFLERMILVNGILVFLEMIVIVSGRMRLIESCVSASSSYYQIDGMAGILLILILLIQVFYSVTTTMRYYLMVR